MGSFLEPLETFFYTHPFEPSAEPVLIKVMGSYSGTALKRDGPLNSKKKKATSTSNGSCSSGRVCSPGDPGGREALQLPSLPQEVSSRSTLHAPEDPTQEKPFYCEHCEKAFNHSGNPSGHTLGSSSTCAPSVTCLLLPGVSQIPPGNPFRTTGPGPCPRVQVGNSQRFVTSVTQRVGDMGRASEDIGSRGFHLHE